MNAPATKSREAEILDASASFRAFFGELREAFLEREWLFTQLELALLCREHVLIIGPPGTAKSAIAAAVLGRIVDEVTHQPSLFSKQLAENTVQTDLIGPVDFKVLTETGRTEHLTEEGMLGAVHAFLDEVFDGRDMLLRSILNVLHERELKHGRKVTPGRCECAVMTSNRYLSEVIERSPETLQAFADRISFICFTPKSFARRTSRAKMLARAQGGERPTLQAHFTLQALDALQELVKEVEVPPVVAEGLEQLGDTLERELLAQVAKLPDYVPTKYFSQRSMVKALWALKAVVVRDRIYRRPERRLVADLADLEMLRYFFLLGGPPAGDLEPLFKGAADPRERAQLEIIRVEGQAFDDAFKRLVPSLEQSVEREAAELAVKGDLGSAEALGRSWAPAVASVLAKGLKEKLIPGPRHPENRGPLVRAAEGLASALEARLAKGVGGPADGRSGVVLLGSLLDGFELLRRIPELERRAGPVAQGLSGFAAQAASMTALWAESSEFDEQLRLDGVAALGENLIDELRRIIEVNETAGQVDASAAEVTRRDITQARGRIGAALRRRAGRAFGQTLASRRSVDPLAELAADGRRLRQIDHALAELSAEHVGLLAELLTPLGAAYARNALSSAPFSRVEQLARVLGEVLENLRREGVPTRLALADIPAILERRLEAHIEGLQPPPPASPDPAQATSGEAYAQYRQVLAANPLDGEAASVRAVSSKLVEVGSRALEPGLARAVTSAELASLVVRVRYLRTWLAQLLSVLPAPEGMRSKAEADHAFDLLVKSRLPMLITREGELVRLDVAARRLAGEPSGRGPAAQGPEGETMTKLVHTIGSIGEDFMSYAKRLLDVRARK